MYAETLDNSDNLKKRTVNCFTNYLLKSLSKAGMLWKKLLQNSNNYTNFSRVL